MSEESFNPYITMSIASMGSSTLPKIEKRISAPRDVIDISDIDGARSAPKYRLFPDKPQFNNSDIPGATSKPLIHSRNVRDNTLYIDDIDGTRRAIKDRMMRTGRHVDPLQPTYNLPTFVPVEPERTKFIKDPLNISDIEGTKIIKQKEWSTRNILDTSDIEGSHPGSKTSKLINSITTRNILDTSDIYQKKSRTSRVTDPIQPEYRVNGMEIKDDQYSKPKPIPNLISDGHLLQTKDISGAFADTKSAPHFQRREFRNTNFIQDIQGAHADSIKHSITTNRTTHPLQPIYQSLDQGELLLPLIPPLVPAEMIKVPTLPPTKPNSLDTNHKPNQEEAYGNTWGTTGNFGNTTMSFNQENDLDPVLFTSTTGNSTFNQKPPTGRKSSLALPIPNNASNTYNQSNFTVNSDRINRNSNPTSSRNKSSGPSPRVPLTPTQMAAQRRAYAEKAEEIYSVRQLQ